jgi:ATP-binding cassette, subfamily B, bacterial
MLTTHSPISRAPMSHMHAWKLAGRWPRWRRVPIIRQRDGIESGAVCLAMVLAYFGRPRMLAQCRVACNPGRDGLIAADLVDAARALGLYARDWIVQGADSFCDSRLHSRLHLPAVVYWQGRRFVIVERITHGHVTIVDPALGRRRLTRGAFDRCCSGVALTFACGEQTALRATRAWRFERRKSDQAGSSNDAGGDARRWFDPVRDLLREIRQAPEATWMAGLLIVSTIALQICSLALPIATLLVVDHVLPVAVEPSLLVMGTAGLLVALSHTMLRFVRSEALAHLAMRVETRWGQEMLSRIVRLPFRILQRHTATDLLTRIGGNDAIRGYVAAQAIAACLDGWFVIFSLLLMAVWSPVLAALAGGVGLLQIGLAVAASRRLRIGIEREVAADAEAQACLMDVLCGLADVKVAGCQEHAIERWSVLTRRRLEVSECRQRFGSMVEASLSGIGLCALLGLLVLGAHEVLAGRLSMGVMLALSVLAAGALIPLGEMTGRLQSFRLARARFERLRDVLDVPSALQTSDAGGSGAEVGPVGSSRGMDAPVFPLRAYFSGAVRVERLCFRYQQGGPLVLDDVSFAVGAGDLVAIVGRAGSGKSTLARLLAGLYAPSSGSVWLDRWPVSSLDGWRVRGQCGVVLQDSVLFNQTIRENIAFGRNDLSFDQIMRAARVANVHDEIMRMPMGYDTRVFEDGSGLSGSERQRLLIARAVAHRPALLILDEAMNQLDVEIEQRVGANLAGLACTRIVIGHRVSMVRDADLVLVLDRGRIVEQGSPEMLMRHRGLFATLADEQGTA